MSDDRMVHPNSPVHFEHWCDHELIPIVGRHVLAAPPFGLAAALSPKRSPTLAASVGCSELMALEQISHL